MKSFTITLCPTLCRYKLSDLNQCSLEVKSIYCGLNLLWKSEKFPYREIYKHYSVPRKYEFSREMIITDLADEA